MWFIAAAVLVITGAVSAYVAVGFARADEKKRGYIECEQRLDVLRRQLTRLRSR